MLWVDDMVLVAKNINELLAHIGKFIQLCEKLNVKLHSVKCRFYETEVSLRD